TRFSRDWSSDVCSSDLGVAYPVLVPNLQGYERARAAGAEEVAVFTAASEAFNRKNTNASIDESIERFMPVLERARADGVRVRGRSEERRVGTESGGTWA